MYTYEHINASACRPAGHGHVPHITYRKKRLDRLATVTNRSRSFLTNKAVERYLAEEEDFIASVHEGIADVDAGRTYTPAEVKKFVTKHRTKVG